MKKILSVFVFLLVLVCAVSVCAEEYQTVEVYVNGDLLVSDAPAILYNSRTMVPLRAISEKLGCDVGWDDKTQTAEIKNAKTAVYVTINSDVLVKKDIATDKNEEIKIDAPAMLYKERTMIPLRAVSEALDAKVDWDAENECALITVNEITTAYGVVNEEGYISEDLKIRFIAGEGVKMLGYTDSEAVETKATTAEEVDMTAATEFGAFYDGYAANITFAISPETDVAPADYLEYFKGLFYTNQDGYTYTPALKLEDKVICGIDFKKLAFIVQSGDEKLNMDYYAGIVNGRMVITGTLYTDASREKALELLGSIVFNF